MRDNSTQDIRRKNARDILEALRDNNLPPWLEEKIRVWFADPQYREDKDAGLEEIFDEMVKSGEPSLWTKRECLSMIKKLGFSPETINRYETELVSESRMPSTLVRPVRSKRRIAFSVAAVVIPFLVIAGGLLLWFSGGEGTVGQPPVAGITVMVEDGGQRQLMLPDSSWVWINDGSKVVYAEDFNSDRSVYLEGEAYFSVKNTGGAPFTVTTRNLTTVVKGTQFNVKAYETDHIAEVRLVEGLVDVHVGRKTYSLKPEDRLVYDKDVSSVRLDHAEGNKGSAWIEWMEFEDMHLYDVFAFVADRYNVLLEVRGTIHPRERVSARVRFDADIDGVMRILQHTVDSMEYEISGDRVVVTMGEE